MPKHFRQQGLWTVVCNIDVQGFLVCNDQGEYYASAQGMLCADASAELWQPPRIAFSTPRQLTLESHLIITSSLSDGLSNLPKQTMHLLVIILATPLYM